MNKYSSRLRIVARDLEIAYGSFTALRIPQLKLGGKVIAVIGHNGSGKSTFIKSVLGLLPPRRGVLRAVLTEDGERTVLEPSRDMAFSPENGAVFAELSVEAYVKLWCRIKLNDGNYYKKQGAKYLEKLGVAGLLPKLGRELSKGQRRRVQTAIGLLTKPRVFLFDEPFCGLDIQQSSELANIMNEETSRMSLVISSHRMEVVERLADLVVVLENGRVLTTGTVDDVCKELCEKSVVIHEPENPHYLSEQVFSALRREYSNCLVNRIGGNVSITGENFDIDSLRSILIQLNLSNAKLDLVRPSLVDAMNYHLMRLRIH